MADISKLAFLKTIWLLKDYPADIVIGGGWAPLIYYHYLLGDKTKNPVRTFDIDLMVKNTVPIRGERSVDQVLTHAGLSAEYKSMDKPPIIHYEGAVENCEVEIEFLTDQKGSTPDIVIEVQTGLHAEALRYISVATDNTLAVTIDDFEDKENSAPFQVTVPSPQAYIFQKGLVFEKRREKQKKAKDLYYIFEVLLNCNAIEGEIINGLSDLRSRYSAWFNKFMKNLSFYFADSSSDGVLMVLDQRPAYLLPALDEEQFKQYVYGSLSKLIKKLANWEK
jgi:hypothetical protein